jgi:hypothetical protein
MPQHGRTGADAGARLQSPMKRSLGGIRGAEVHAGGPATTLNRAVRSSPLPHNRFLSQSTTADFTSAVPGAPRRQKTREPRLLLWLAGPRSGTRDRPNSGCGAWNLTGLNNSVALESVRVWIVMVEEKVGFLAPASQLWESQLLRALVPVHEGHSRQASR